MVKKSPNVKIVMDEVEMGRALKRIAHQIIEANKGVDDIILVGVIQRGVPIAKRLAEIITAQEKNTVPVGSLDVSLYRDDLTEKGSYIEVKKSDIPFKVDGKVVVLVDDVIYAGRTARAALDGLKDYGRAAKVQLAALIDRGHRELPIHPDFTGKVIPTSKKEEVKVEIMEIDGIDRVVIK
ncbi:bifunctional pyr operon transcriptional regulator/uracil phosphoribosyltransferase [candidate division WOR-1 bacterium RIFOXYA12_FULL_52_29]|uniref:Bifunctional protein PyrR n=1 Tax=candidate division WOR-1 bacterium RIFOXYC12_FULL_54_18 TaxID=1802584 RepID=A0A1F4T3U7_UNCSA|nr:MAG: bifunctional pyr operon transcriptional regulator/uracil phosphoribosyltransferase [candidate division WOR-1 bacterium RIFOXYA2_FULL_51_19]OGC17068.1 MAG: bifunctional pyr operon transcriptional regulator/uracil phosphoribosyltransferase [candidate division WOR-1 bacterium RIFOXYA12_FULL_52_29]OGC25929.1 MAG: bifunctional pyr operon transcriptional regulator/uracil phosphoribosyltransferase [candidate division WOR-1 bacterium RIFOXYB2_FULL_45_9]OGC27485.1 MAG: bifunctional pyr operon tra